MIMIIKTIDYMQIRRDRKKELFNIHMTGDTIMNYFYSFPVTGRMHTRVPSPVGSDEKTVRPAFYTIVLSVSVVNTQPSGRFNFLSKNYKLPPSSGRAIKDISAMITTHKTNKGNKKLSAVYFLYEMSDNKNMSRYN